MGHVPHRTLRQRRQGPRLRVVLLLYVVAPLAAVVWVGWFVTLTRVEELTERRMQEEIELVARALSLPLSRALDQGSASQLRLSLQATEGINRVYGAYVYGVDGNLIASFGIPPQPDDRQIPEIAAVGDRTGEYGEVAGRRIYSYFVPLTDAGGRIAGVLEVTRRRSEFDEYIAELRTQTAAALAGFTVILVGLVWWGHHRTLGRHVERLATDMARVREGDRQHRAELGGFHEISTLGASLNTMLDGIERSQRQLDEQREAHAALKNRLHRTETLVAIGGLAAGVAHELGTPLSVVHGRAQRLLRDTSLPDGTARHLREIRDQVHRMETIVRQLLDFGKQRSTDPHLTNVADVIERVASSVADLAASTGVAVTLDVAADGARVLPDPEGLDLAVDNLVRNAIQAAPGGAVVLRASALPDAVHIIVDDNGPGVPVAIRAQVFDPFFTTKPAGQGTGLGLALAQRLISDMGGTVDVDTSPLGGARFTVTVPSARTHMAQQDHA